MPLAKMLRDFRGIGAFFLFWSGYLMARVLPGVFTRWRCIYLAVILVAVGIIHWVNNWNSNTSFLNICHWNLINCTRLITKDTEEYNKAFRLMKYCHSKKKSSDTYVQLTQNCKAFVASRRYLPRKVTKEEAAFPLAFGILVYKDVELAERLLRAIYRPHNQYCFHVDATAATDVRQAFEGIASCFDNVFLSSVSYDVGWGDISIVLAELVCMKDLLKRGRWKYYINLTGHEFPLKTNLELVKILTAYKGANDIQADVGSAQYFIERYKYKWYWKYWYGLHSFSLRPPPPHGMRIAMGSTHMAGTRDYVSYVTTNQKAIDFLKWCEGTKIPDETYFQTLNANSQLGVPGAHNGSGVLGATSMMRYKLWSNLENTCSGNVVRGICHFSIRELPGLVNAPQLFANKFSLTDEPVTYGCIEAWLDKKEQSRIMSHSIEIYKQMPFVKDDRKTLLL